MGLREQAAADLRTILADESGFGWPIWIYPPTGEGARLTGFSNDVAQMIDPQTGQAVSGRVASIALSIADLDAANLGLPRAIASKASKPWLVQFCDIGGKQHLFKVSEANPDRALGVVTCLLEPYKE